MKRNIVIFFLSLIIVAFMVSLSCGSCGKKESTEDSKTETASPPPQDQPSEPPTIQQVEIKNLHVVWTGNRYYDDPYYRGPYSRNQTGYWHFNGTDYVYKYRADNLLKEQDLRMGDNFKIEFDVGLIGSAPIENLVIKLAVPGQFSVESEHGSASEYGDYTVIHLDPIKILNPGGTKHYSICVLLCNSNDQYKECDWNTLESKVIAEGNGVYKEALLTIEVWKWCEEGRGPCYYSSCCTSCPNCPGCPTPETPCPPQPPVVPPPAPPVPQPEPCIPEPVIGPPAPPASGQQPIFQPGGSSPGGSSGGSGGPLPNSAIP